jgi:4-hydroxy-3-polyprenylbenzoate decarboxylase
MGYYKDIRDLIAALERSNLLVRVDREINKDTQLHPLVRLQFRGLPEAERKAFLFTKVTDSSGRRYDIPVVIACLAASRQIYGLGLQCDPDKINQRWIEARTNPIEPKIVHDAPVHEEVHLGADIDKPGLGLEEFPIPISTPGFDAAPYTSASHFITYDPETGVRNIGNYRGMVKARTRLGMNAGGPATHFPTLAQMAETREAHAGCRSHRRAAEHLLRVGGEDSLWHGRICRRRRIGR